MKVNHPEIVRDNVRDILAPSTPVATLHVVPRLCDSSSPSMSCPSTSNTLSGSLTLSNTPQKSNSSPPTKHSPFSDLLNIPPSTSTPKTGKARVLTSSECLQLLKEKENQKQKVAAEKERRKLERELRKKQREDEQKRKTAEREAAKVKKVEEKQKKSLEKALKRKPTSSMAPRPKRNRARGDMDETIHTDLCCICFGTYDEDIDTG